ncbi:MFS transporter [Alloscardovia criceti]|uniref:MFS transporter n=1 Tax=Alloscardovia criceti TaxID=356828 RepID=UPI00037C325A|nr:MFS transporter [Alloscardovia criceti]
MKTSENNVAPTKSATNSTKIGFIRLVPIFIAFFVMAFVDLVGTATNYVKPEFNLSNSTANLFTTMVFFWFLLLSVPTSILMNKIGRRMTVILSIWITVAAMIVPIFAYLATQGRARFVLIVISFCLLGIGNTLNQVSLNPLMAAFVSSERVSSMLTLGQFIRSIASLLAPYIASWMLIQFGAWWGLYVVYLIVAVVGALALQFDKIDEPEPTTEVTVGSAFSLLKNRAVLLGFFAIIAHVGMDVGMNAQAPRILMEHTGIALSTATSATMVYFIGRMFGSFLGGIFLPKMSGKTALQLCGGIMLFALFLFYHFSTAPTNPPVWEFWIATFIIGFGNVNIFSIVLAQLLNDMPEHQNEISGLMITGLVGGAIVPPIMGIAADLLGQVGAVMVVNIGVAYIILLGVRFSLLQMNKSKK